MTLIPGFNKMVKPKTKKQKEYMRKWYIKNRRYHLNNVKRRQKANNYSAEKTEKQRKIRYIKRKTRLNFPIVYEQKCEVCGGEATEHHHYTTPIKYDEFIYVCHDCHCEEDLKLNKHSKLHL